MLDDRPHPELLRQYAAQIAAAQSDLIDDMMAKMESTIEACMSVAELYDHAGQRDNAARAAEVIRGRLDTARALKGRA